MVIDHGKHARHGSGEHPGRGQFFRTATLGERGQIVTPKAARDHFELTAADKLLMLGGLTAAVSAAVYIWVVDRWFVGRDETAMGAAFGAAYTEYRRAVRRRV